MTVLRTTSYIENILSNQKHNIGHADRNGNTTFANVLGDEINRYGQFDRLYQTDAKNSATNNTVDGYMESQPMDREAAMDKETENGRDETTEEVNSDYLRMLKEIYNFLAMLEMAPEYTNIIEWDGPSSEIEKSCDALVRILGEYGLCTTLEDMIEATKAMEDQLSYIEEKLNDSIKTGILNPDGLLTEEIHRKLGELDRIFEEFNLNAQWKQKNDSDLQSTGAIAIEGRQESTDQLFWGPESNEGVWDDIRGNMDHAIMEREADPKEQSSTTMDFNTLILNMPDRIEFENNLRMLDEPLLEMNKAEVFERIIDEARLIMDADRQEIRLKLKPDFLGELILRIESNKGSLLAKVMVDNYRTKELIEANLYRLEEGIRRNGLDIKTFEVFVGNNDDFQREGSQYRHHLNRKAKKMNGRGYAAEEIPPYEDAIEATLHEIHMEGRLNLFA
ncbi:MAG: flagellar hook-length control protein FliK [Tissierellia bacterium]|nr:flagellar hook-length control protein FliK [Tissierellia bacterium]